MLHCFGDTDQLHYHSPKVRQKGMTPVRVPEPHLSPAAGGHDEEGTA